MIDDYSEGDPECQSNLTFLKQIFDMSIQADAMLAYALTIHRIRRTPTTFMPRLNSARLLVRLCLQCLGVTLAVAQAPMPAVLRNYQPVTAERLRKPEDGNWLMNRRTYDGWGYSPLDQITPANVARLRPVWIFSSNDLKPHESAPLVNNGVMFVTTPTNQVIAIDVKTGNLLWRYKRPRPAGSIVPNEPLVGFELADPQFG